jgi:exonuclease VII large subunit
VIEAACDIWEAYGAVHLQLQAVGTLEPDAAAMVDRQREEQRAEVEALTRRLAKAGRLRAGLSQPRAAATLHMLTSLESFTWLRRGYGLSLRQTRDTIADLANALLKG